MEQFAPQLEFSQMVVGMLACFTKKKRSESDIRFAIRPLLHNRLDSARIWLNLATSLYFNKVILFDKHHVAICFRSWRNIPVGLTDGRMDELTYKRKADL
jgi:hypothetical protein